MRFVVTGLSHRSAPIEIRERFAQAVADPSVILAQLKKLDFLEEICVISTCNRVEFYSAGGVECAVIARSVRSFLQQISGFSPADLDPHLYQHSGVDGLRHLFRVASSLDSMVLGEPQILGQVKNAYRAALAQGTAGTTLTRAFERAFQVAKRVRTETGVAENAVSMSFAAVELGREIFTSLEGKEVLLLGAGKMSTLAAKHLKAYGVSQVRVANRSLETAQRLADSIGGLASSLSDLPVLLLQADIVISSTASPHFVVDKKLMAKVVRERRYRPILFVDIAVPRDIDPAIADLDNVFVYDIDDLASVLEGNRESRAKEAAAAEQIVGEELASYLRWARSQQVVPMIKVLRERAMVIADAEIDRTLSHVKTKDEKTEQSIRAMAQAIVNKMLHPVLTRLKKESAEGDPQALLDSIQVLFQIEREDLGGDLESSDLAESSDLVDEDGSNIVPLRQQDAGSKKP